MPRAATKNHLINCTLLTDQPVLAAPLLHSLTFVSALALTIHWTTLTLAAKREVDVGESVKHSSYQLGSLCIHGINVSKE
jgi:hypothetical protein